MSGYHGWNTHRASCLLLTCFMSEFGNQSAIVYVRNYKKLKITVHPDNATVLEYRRFTFHCEANGDSPIHISWFRNNSRLPKKGQNFKVVKRTGALKFFQVRVVDRGFYQCKAENGKESVLSETAYLRVECKQTTVPRYSFNLSLGVAAPNGCYKS
ncbi:hypothetical protein KUTeg_017133 [Tegillarca granosa]|uniref:Ig-like domain-containing protein n=1 Tax=Tegillarca granosa TaxID=220873 RepID=A0ABQ9EMV7_TEGGR|nr:hypothetical protein KUTeg_017133 [Tegillarca granosa]